MTMKKITIGLSLAALMVGGGAYAAQDRMRPDADAAEHLYQHDIGLQRVRRHLRREAEQQIAALQARGLPLGLPA